MPSRIAFVGPLPPPLNGFSNICARMLSLLERENTVEVFDRAPPKAKRWWWSVEQVLVKPAKYLRSCLMHRDVPLYLALSGGRGQLIDACYLVLARLFGRAIFVHHHSFAYLNAPTRLTRFVLKLSGTATHIALSRGMGATLSREYGLERSRLRCVSNAAFYGEGEPGQAGRDLRGRPLKVGYLSNITFEKGFVEFFATLKQLDAMQVDYLASIAGPVAGEAKAEFERCLKEASRANYVGPVYGEAKERFYRDLDVFLFPTHYQNEAEPLVVYEALRSGVYVIACDRGAIAEMLGGGAGAAFPQDLIVQAAAHAIAAFHADRGSLEAAQATSLSQARRIQESGLTELQSLLSLMQGRADSLVGQL
jgi:glycosyltransferase involved in cell wall biosynthesis